MSARLTSPESAFGTFWATCLSSAKLRFWRDPPLREPYPSGAGPARSGPPTALRAELCLVLLTGCIPEGLPKLLSVVDAQSADTVAQASVPVTASLVLFGMAAELCTQDDPWAGHSEGDLPPLSDTIATALGNPSISAISRGIASVSVDLEPTSILDQTDVDLRLDIDAGAPDLSVLVQTSDMATETGFGSASVDVREGCETDNALVRGSASWTDSLGQDHTVSFPEEEDTDFTAGFGGDVPYVPVKGKLKWSGTIDSETRTFVTENAANITTEDAPDTAGLTVADWPGTASSVDWIIDISMPIAP